MYSQMIKKEAEAVVYVNGELKKATVTGYAFKAKGDLSEPMFEFKANEGEIIEMGKSGKGSEFVAVMSEDTFNSIAKESKSRVQGALNRSSECGYKVTGDFLNVAKMTVEKGVTKEGVKADEIARYWRNVTKKVACTGGWQFVKPWLFAMKAEKTYSSVEAMLSAEREARTAK